MLRGTFRPETGTFWGKPGGGLPYSLSLSCEKQNVYFLLSPGPLPCSTSVLKSQFKEFLL